MSGKPKHPWPMHSRLLKEGSYLGFVRLPVASIVFLRAPGHVRAVSELTGFLCVTRKTQDTWHMTNEHISQPNLWTDLDHARWKWRSGRNQTTYACLVKICPAIVEKNKGLCQRPFFSDQDRLIFKWPVVSPPGQNKSGPEKERRLNIAAAAVAEYIETKTSEINQPTKGSDKVHKCEK